MFLVCFESEHTEANDECSSAVEDRSSSGEDSVDGLCLWAFVFTVETFACSRKVGWKVCKEREIVTCGLGEKHLSPVLRAHAKVLALGDEIGEGDVGAEPLVSTYVPPHFKSVFAEVSKSLIS
jgi:hypothetical protein